ncbi:carbonic anhydrase family protein [Actinomycetes bacterium KLBMP 9797]
MVLREAGAGAAAMLERSDRERPGPPAPAWRQSPIEIWKRNAVPASGRVPELAYTATTVRLRRENRADPRESTVYAEVAEPGSGGHLTWQGERYDLHSVHWHTPSEHSIDGRYFAMEQHMRHDGPGGRILVLATFLEEREGGDDGLFGTLMRDLPAGDEPSRPLEFDARHLLPHSLGSYQYQGSLTTAPFRDGIQWVVLAEPLAVAPESVDRFVAAFPRGNTRAVQPRYDRAIHASS